MLKYVHYMLLLSSIACLTACGGGGSTNSPTQIYSPLPATGITGPITGSVGGSVQGPTGLSIFNNVSTATGIARSAGFVNYSTVNGPPARFNHPTDITTNGTEYFVADYGNNAIRQVTPSTGRVTTLTCTDANTGLATGFNRPSSITTIGTNLYVVDSGSNTVRKIDLSNNKVTIIGSTLGLAGSVDSSTPANVRFNRPTGITTDGVNIYVTDTGNNTVRWLDSSNKVSTLAGASGTVGSADGIQGTARFNQPGRITTDGVNLYLTDFGNRTVRMIAIATGTVTTIAGIPGKLGTDEGTLDGAGATARFNQPNGITTDGKYIYVTDTYQNTIRRIEKSAPYTVTTLSGISGTAGIGGAVNSPGIPSFYTPIGITTNGSALYVADSYNHTIRKIQ